MKAIVVCKQVACIICETNCLPTNIWKTVYSQYQLRACSKQLIAVNYRIITQICLNFSILHMKTTLSSQYCSVIKSSQSAKFYNYQKSFRNPRLAVNNSIFYFIEVQMHENLSYNLPQNSFRLTVRLRHLLDMHTWSMVTKLSSSFSADFS